MTRTTTNSWNCLPISYGRIDTPVEMERSRRMKQRTKNKGLAALRRSSRKQETSLETQLDWAIVQAKHRGIILDATQQDLVSMRLRKLHSYKAIRLDDSVTGADLNRPGLTSLIEDAHSNPEISHILVFKRDRLGRPDNPLPMMMIEAEILRAGVTLVFSDGIVEPTSTGQTNLPHLVQSLFEYHASGEFLNSLAERMLIVQQHLAKQGYRTGGNPPYGFARVLVDPNGEEIEELPQGRIVRQAGCHVKNKPKEWEKIGVWTLILELKYRGWGTKRIAKHLDDLGIPSPDAGKTRTDHGVKHEVTGKWSHNTVSDLCRNSAILGYQQYGRRSEGAHRRIGDEGPRCLDDSDRNQNGCPKTVNNDASNIVRGNTGFAAQFDIRKWEEIQQQMDERGQRQRGIPRCKDPSKYPLSCLIVDMTDGCGSIMYGVTSGKRRLYQCGIYQRTSGQECFHNTIDAEAMLRFTMQTVRQLVDRRGNRAKLERLLRQRAERDAIAEGRSSSESDVREEVPRKQVAELRADLAIVERRMATEKDDSRYEVIARQFDAVSNELKSAQKRLARIERLQSMSSKISVEEEVEAALSLLNDISKITNDIGARAEINPLLRNLGVEIGLDFKTSVKGKTRAVQRLATGIVSFGNAGLPVKLFGRRNRNGNDSASQGCQNTSSKADFASSNQTRETDRSTSDDRKGETKSSLEADTRSSPRHREGISLTKVNRDDRI